MKSQQVSRVLVATATILGFWGLGSAAFAAQDSDTFQVTATVQSVCTITANDLAFGAYDPSAGDSDASTTLDVTCTNGTDYDIGLSGTVGSRAMAGPGGATLNYALFRDASRTLPWGLLGGGQDLMGTGNGAAQNVTVYGRVPGGQFSTSGAYSDSVTATIEFF